MNERYRVVLVENQTIMREGFRLLLSGEKDFEIVGEDGIGQEALRLVEKTNPDLVVSGLSTHPIDGMDMIAAIKKQNPNIKVVALSGHQNEEYVVGTLNAGADGYILIDVSCIELVLAFRRILRGECYLSPEISGDLIKGYLEGKRVKEGDLPWEILSNREREILRQIAVGMTNNQTAHRLGISVKTVEAHRYHIMKKLNVHNGSALIKVAMEKGLIHQ
jgi:DNA-binding NarL/FixJ family response regulator